MLDDGVVVQLDQPHRVDGEDGEQLGVERPLLAAVALVVVSLRVGEAAALGEALRLDASRRLPPQPAARLRRVRRRRVLDRHVEALLDRRVRERAEHLEREAARARDERAEVAAALPVQAPRDLRAEDDEEGEEHADDLVALRPVAREDVEAAVALDAVAHRQQRVDLVVPRVRLAVGERERKGAEARGDDDLDEHVRQHRAAAPADERLEPDEEAERVLDVGVYYLILALQRLHVRRLGDDRPHRPRVQAEVGRGFAGLAVRAGRLDLDGHCNASKCAGHADRRVMRR